MSVQQPPQGKDRCAKTGGNHVYRHQFETQTGYQLGIYACNQCGHVKETKERG